MPSPPEMERPTWKFTEITAYGAECPHCGDDLLAESDYACWVQKEGVKAALEYLDFCPKCNRPITERGYELDEDAAEDVADAP